MSLPEQRLDCPTCRTSTPHQFRVSYVESVGRRAAVWVCTRCGQVNPQQFVKGQKRPDER